MTGSNLATASPPDGDPRPFVVQRDGDRDLAFRGWLIGTGRYEFDARSIDVAIYLTTGGRLVTWTAWQAPSKTGRAGASHETAAGALAWLRQQNKGRLGPASKAAWTQACTAWPPLEAEATERVE